MSKDISRDLLQTYSELQYSPKVAFFSNKFLRTLKVLKLGNKIYNVYCIALVKNLQIVIEGNGTRSMGICSTAVMTGLLSHALKLLSMMKMAALLIDQR